MSTASTYQVQADGYREENGRVGPNNNHNLCIKKVLPVTLVDEEFIMEEISSNAVELIMIFTEIMNKEIANANVTLRFEAIQTPLMWFSTRLSSRMNFSNSLGSNVRHTVTSERQLPHLEPLCSTCSARRFIAGVGHIVDELGIDHP